MFVTESHSICVNVNYLFSTENLHKGASITSSRLVHTRSERHTDFYTNTCVEKLRQFHIVKSLTFMVFLKHTFIKKTLSHIDLKTPRGREYITFTANCFKCHMYNTDSFEF